MIDRIVSATILSHFLENMMVQNMISSYLEHTLRSHHHSVEVYDGGLAKNDKIPFKHN